MADNWADSPFSSYVFLAQSPTLFVALFALSSRWLQLEAGPITGLIYPPPRESVIRAANGNARSELDFIARFFHCSRFMDKEDCARADPSVRCACS
jgi:hypothetical protein